MMVARKTVTIRGDTYPSLMAAGRALGVAQSTISRHMVSGTLDLVGLPLTNCRVLGVVYPTIAAAARALGCHWTTVKHAIEGGREDTVLSGAHPALWKPCRLNGRTFRSQTEASRTLGVHPSAISAAVKRGASQVGKWSGRHRRGVAT